MMIIACGILFSVSIYLLLEPHITRKVFGLVLLGSTINLIILICGGLDKLYPAFLTKDHIAGDFANPLPQALILTAIVIGFGLLAFLCAPLKYLLKTKQERKNSC